MRIALMTEYFPKTEKAELSGGVEARTFYIGKYLAKRHDVTVFTTPEGGFEGDSRVLGMTVRRIGPPVEYSQSSSLLSRARFIRNAIKEVGKESYDVADGASFVSYPVAWNSRAEKKVATYHDVWVGEWVRHLGLKGLLGEALERYALSRRWDGFIAVSEYTKGKLVEAGVSRDKIAVVHNGVEYEKLERITADKFREPTVCIVSRLVSYKNVDDLVRALPHVKKKIPEVKLKIVGGGPEEGNLRRLAVKLGLEGNVEFMGFVKDHDKVLETIKSSHAFALPSTVEGFGISIIEAMALKVPYVASDIPAIREATHGGAGGLLHKPRDTEDLAGKLIKALEGKVKANADFIQKEYDWKTLAKKIEETYENA